MKLKKGQGTNIIGKSSQLVGVANWAEEQIQKLKLSCFIVFYICICHTKLRFWCYVIKFNWSKDF